MKVTLTKNADQQIKDLLGENPVVRLNEYQTAG